MRRTGTAESVTERPVTQGRFRCPPLTWFLGLGLTLPIGPPLKLSPMSSHNDSRPKSERRGHAVEWRHDIRRLARARFNRDVASRKSVSAFRIL